MKILGPLRMGTAVLCPAADLDAPCGLCVVEIECEPWLVVLSGTHMIIGFASGVATCACGRLFDVYEGQATWLRMPEPASPGRVAAHPIVMPVCAEPWCKP